MKCTALKDEIHTCFYSEVSINLNQEALAINIGLPLPFSPELVEKALKDSATHKPIDRKEKDERFIKEVSHPSTNPLASLPERNQVPHQGPKQKKAE